MRLRVAGIVLALLAPKAMASSLDSIGPAIGQAAGSSYSEAASKAWSAFMIQSGYGVEFGRFEDKIMKETQDSVEKTIGKTASSVVAASFFVGRVIRDQRLTTSVNNPIFGQTNRLSVGTSGMELSQIKGWKTMEHYIRFDSSGGGAVMTGITMPF